MGLAVVAAGCGVSGTTAAATPVPAAAREAVTGWLGHLATHNDAAAFADLAPASQAAVGSLDNYERGSGQFGAVYAQFAIPPAETDQPVRVTNVLVSRFKDS